MRFPQQFDKKQLVWKIFRHFLRQTASEKQTLWNIKWITEDWNHFLKSLSDFPFRTTILSMLVLGIWPGFWILENWKYFDMLYYLKQKHLMVCFIYILDSSNSSSFTFWTSQLTSSSRWTELVSQPVTDKHSSHFSTAKEMSVKATFFFDVQTTTNKFWNDAEMLLKSSWTSHLQMMNGLEQLL